MKSCFSHLFTDHPLTLDSSVDTPGHTYTQTSVQTVVPTGNLVIRNLLSNHAKYANHGCCHEKQGADCELQGKGTLASGSRDIHFTFTVVPSSSQYLYVHVPELALLSCEQLSLFSCYLYLSAACHDQTLAIGPLEITCSSLSSTPLKSSSTLSSPPSSSSLVKPTALAQLRYPYPVGPPQLVPGSAPFAIPFPQVLQQDPTETIRINGSQICFGQPGTYQLDFDLLLYAQFIDGPSNIRLFLTSSCNNLDLPNIASFATLPLVLPIPSLFISYPVPIQVTIPTSGCCITLNAQQLGEIEVGVGGHVSVNLV